MNIRHAHLHVIIKCTYHRSGIAIFGVSYHRLLNFSNLEELNGSVSTPSCKILAIRTKFRTPGNVLEKIQG